VSLAAVVYVKKAHIPVQWLDETLRIDEVTGEPVSTIFHIPAKVKEAVRYRLGNGKYILRCKIEIEGAAKARGLAMPVLFEQVISGEVQAGDVVRFTDIFRLKREIKLLDQQTSKYSVEVKELLFRLNRLAEAAEANQNPIAFI
jgi:hypothetical protein